MRFNEGIDIKIVYCDDTPSEYIDDVTMNDIYDILDSSSDICKIVDVSGSKKKVVWTDEYGFEKAYKESKKSIHKSMKENINGFDKAIAKKYNGTEANGVGQYYLDWRFDLKDEMDNIEMLADKFGVKVEFQSDDGYFEVFEESKKSARKSMKESTEITEPRMAWISLLNHVCNFSNTIHSDSLWKALKKNPREEITLDEFVDECEKFVDMTKIRGMIEDYLGNDKQIEDNLKMYGLWNFSDKFAESKKSMKKSLKESKDSDFFNGIAKEYHFSKDEKTRYKDKTHISAIGVLFDRINDAIKIYGRNSDEEYNALNDCWSVITSAKQNGWNVDYEEDKWNKIARLPNYH